MGFNRGGETENEDAEDVDEEDEVDEKDPDEDGRDSSVGSNNEGERFEDSGVVVGMRTAERTSWEWGLEIEETKVEFVGSRMNNEPSSKQQ